MWKHFYLFSQILYKTRVNGFKYPVVPTPISVKCSTLEVLSTVWCLFKIALITLCIQHLKFFGPLFSLSLLNCSEELCCVFAPHIWVRWWRCSCFVTWFCYQLIAKPGNKTTAPAWPDSHNFSRLTGACGWNPSQCKGRGCLSYIINFMAGSKQFFWNIPLSAWTVLMKKIIKSWLGF